MADVVCVDLSRYHFGPVLDPVRALITCGTGQDVDAVFVGGEPVVLEGPGLNADEDALRAAAPASCKACCAPPASATHWGARPNRSCT